MEADMALAAELLQAPGVSISSDRDGLMFFRGGAGRLHVRLHKGTCSVVDATTDPVAVHDKVVQEATARIASREADILAAAAAVQTAAANLAALVRVFVGGKGSFFFFFFANTFFCFPLQPATTVGRARVMVEDALARARAQLRVLNNQQGDDRFKVRGFFRVGFLSPRLPRVLIAFSA
jgi:hypothetical protein